MIVVRLMGGLGNQMFQYAAGFALARRHGAPLRFDLDWFDRVHMHQGLELPRVFGLDVLRVTAAELRQTLGWLASPRMRRVFGRRRLRPLHPASFALEPHFHYWPGFASLGPVVYLDGYWQSERYFASVAAEIRERFRFLPEPDEKSRRLIAEMEGCASVSLHVRRGDYVRNAVAKRVHGVNLQSYYPAAITEIYKLVANPRFFVFSDEPDWVAAHLALPPSAILVNHNRGENSFRDMQLMSHCRHHILANSSFSWWGAWLNPRTDKIVVAPRRWFNVDDFDTRDLYCPGWIVL